MKLTECKTIGDLLEVYNKAGDDYEFIDCDNGQTITLIPVMECRVAIAYDIKNGESCLMRADTPILICPRVEEGQDGGLPFFTLTVPSRELPGADDRDPINKCTMFFFVNYTCRVNDIIL